MDTYTKEDVLEFIKEEDVKFVRLAFFTLTGEQKNISIMASEIERAFDSGVSFNSSAIAGFSSEECSDMLLFPDPETITILPWRPMTGKVVRIFCTMRRPNGEVFEKDVRSILKRAMEDARENYGLEFSFSAELEFYLFKLNEDGKPSKEPFDRAGYLDIAPSDHGENIRRDICFTLEQMGISPSVSHHEAGPGQNEIDFHPSDPLTTADNIETFKWVVRTKAEQAGLFADFSPKPLPNDSGSAMHINIAIQKISSNKSNSETGNNSPEIESNARSEMRETCTEETESLMRFALAGILNHTEEITLFLNPTSESYNRLGEGNAPKFISWGFENRTTLIRIPQTKKKDELKVFQHRQADCTINPYLVLSLLIYSALDGIKNKTTLPAPRDENLFSLAERATKNIRMIPDTIEEATRHVKKSRFIESVIGKNLVQSFLSVIGENE